jgi:hypothetical protein
VPTEAATWHILSQGEIGSTDQIRRDNLQLTEHGSSASGAKTARSL